MLPEEQVRSIAERYRDDFCESCMARMVELARPVEARLSRGLPPWPWHVKKLTEFHSHGLCDACRDRVLRHAR